MDNRYEILPFGAAEHEAAAARKPLVVTVTCSPRHGVHHTVDVATRIAALGHEAVVHLAARMIRGPEHLDAILERLAGRDVFVIGGDAREPQGPYASAVELLPIIAVHPFRPRRIGIAAYPEGHPLIDPAVLDDALADKAPLADYMVSQMCFDPAALLRWLERARAAGIALPLYAGLPGAVDRRRLLEVSMRVGVGTSVAFLRKQSGLRHLLGRPEHDRLYEALAPEVGGALGIAGLHFFTFNRLLATLAWEASAGARHRAAGDA
jgi:methylenetetrahydrofolate reductase (NADH)